MHQILIVSILIIGFCAGFDVDQYKKRHQLQVVVPYKHAVTIIATEIIEYLATGTIPKSASSGLQVVEKLHILTERFRNDLSDADEASTKMKDETDREVERLVAESSQVEQQIAANQKRLEEVIAQIQQATIQLADAQKQVDVVRASVEHAQTVLEGEERKVRKEEHCMPIGILDFLCKVVDVFFGNIEGAKRARDSARNDLNGQQQRLNQCQATFNQYQHTQTELQQTRTNFEATKTQLNTQLTQSNEARDMATNANIQIKAILTYVGTLLGKSQVLSDVIKHLIDMETMIIPLTAVGDQIIGYSADPDDIAYFNAIKEKIARNLPLVQLKMPQYELIHVG